MQACINGIQSFGEYVGQNCNFVTGCWNSLTQTTSVIAGNILGAETPLWEQVSNLEKGMTITKPAFERGPGFWSRPDDERIHSIFGELTNINSQRENWYSVSPYIGEFWCTVSNVGFIYVGLKHQSPEFLFAGAASVLSHSIPKQWLLTVDKIGACVATLKLMSEYRVVLNHPWLTVPVAVVGVIASTDLYLSRKHGTTLPHVMWHLSAAFAANAILSCVSEQAIH